MLVRLLLPLLLCLFAQTAYARQLGWKADTSGYYARYTISWQDFAGQSQTLSFEVENNYVEQAQQDSRKLDTRAAMQAAYVKAVKEARRAERKGVSVQVIPNGGNLSFQASGPDERTVDRELERIRRLANKEMESYLQEHNYTIEGNAIETDYAKVSRANYFAMRPLARAIQEQTRGMDMRSVMDYTLAFLQSIPYSTYQPRPGDRTTAIFNTPLRLIANNKGDCDDKSLAFGTLLKIMYPSLTIALVLVPEHAFVAVEVPTQPGDTILRDGGHTYVLAEPVGPDYYAFGRIAASSAQLTRQGYTLRPVPDRY
ncbi:MAG: hypothetical protein GC134_04410 [Proteobacteria bacterium]|nr:hypothetical protein [Pseudomonadota bacterium]